MAKTPPAPPAADAAPKTEPPAPPAADAAGLASEGDQATPLPDVPTVAAPQLVIMPEATGRAVTAEATHLLLEACDKYGVHPGADQRPRELLSWKYYPANVLEDVRASVVLVTAGGVKVRHIEGGAVDVETEERLRQIFRAFKIDPVTKNVVPAPLPTDQTLPGSAVTGLPTTERHRHPGGYLHRERS